MWCCRGWTRGGSRLRLLILGRPEGGVSFALEKVLFYDFISGRKVGWLGQERRSGKNLDLHLRRLCEPRWSRVCSGSFGS